MMMVYLQVCWNEEAAVTITLGLVGGWAAQKGIPLVSSDSTRELNSKNEHPILCHINKRPVTYVSTWHIWEVPDKFPSLFQFDCEEFKHEISFYIIYKFDLPKQGLASRSYWIILCIELSLNPSQNQIL